jgi:hypothetical protein
MYVSYPSMSLYPTTGTHYADYSITNTGGGLYLAREGSAGGNYAVGSLAYSCVLVNTGAQPIHFGRNCAVQATLAAGGFGLGSQTWGTGATNTLLLADGVAPASSPANAVQITSVSGEAQVRDASGNVTTFSPHAKDAPPQLYDEKPGIELVLRSYNMYYGEIQWMNLETRVLVIESFEKYNKRRGSEPGFQPLIQEDWDANEIERVRIAAERRADWE